MMKNLLSQPLTREQEMLWLRISMAELPPQKINLLLSAYDFDPAALFGDSAAHWSEHSPNLLERQLKRLQTMPGADLDRTYEKLKKIEASILPISHAQYPARLREISDPPPALFVRGRIDPDDKFSVAVVGSRRATEYGLSISRRFASELARRGLCIVSGGARGIDTRAHMGALDAGGRTIVFLGCGLDYNYPSENRRLYDIIAGENRGAVVSEFVPGIAPEPWRFPARNRLISGVSMGVLVIETPLDSGAMITAGDAANQGRDVFAIPGPIDTGKSSGSHKLIQEGAKLVESAQDIMDALGLLTLSAQTEGDTENCVYRPVPADLAPDQRTVLELLSLDPVSVDNILSMCRLTTPQVIGVMTLLEMRGLARKLPGNRFVRAI